MRCCVGCLIALVMAGCLGAEASAAPSEPAASWVYPYLEEMMLLAPTPRFALATGPYSRLDVAAWLAGVTVTGDEVGASRAQWLRAMLAEELAPETAFLGAASSAVSGTSACAAAFDVRLASRFENDRRVKPDVLLDLAVYTEQGLDLWTRFRVSANAPELHKVETRPWRDRWRASVDQGGVDYRAGAFSVFVGRDEIAWGGSRRMGLLLSGSAPSADMIRFSAGRRRLTFTSFHSKLRRGEGDPWTEDVTRFLAGHRLEVLLGEHLDLAVSEVIVYGGPGRSLEPAYLNPLTALYAEQWNSGRDDNVLMGGDLALVWPGRADVRAEVVIDDFQIDAGGEPSEIGAGASLRLVNPFTACGSIVGCSYYLVTNRTYGHSKPWNRLTEEGRPMGYPEGPDADALKIWTSAPLMRDLSLELAYARSRLGEGRIDDAQDEAGRSLRFPSGVVETGQTVRLEAAWRPSYPLGLAAWAAWSETNNAGNIRGASRDRLSLSFRIEYNLRAARVWARGISGE
jgi:hypothetical protein